MFTGIIQTTGSIRTLRREGDDGILSLTSAGLDVSTVTHGDSIAVNGVCLTVTDLRDGILRMALSGETLQRTTLGSLKQGDEVNLETALTPTSKLGGHLVTGHVDAVGEIAGRERVGESVRLTVVAPHSLARYIAEKGSICVDGVSLTVNEVIGAQFAVNIIPHTLQVTTLKDRACGARVNLEVDLIARYLERLLLGGRAAQPSAQGVTRELLARSGFTDGQ